MLFSSITFLYWFLPAVLLIYFAVPAKAKNYVLLAASFLFYFWGEPSYCILMLTACIIGYLAGLGIEKCKELVETLTEEAKAALSVYKESGADLVALADYLCNRDY